MSRKPRPMQLHFLAATLGAGILVALVFEVQHHLPLGGKEDGLPLMPQLAALASPLLGLESDLRKKGQVLEGATGASLEEERQQSLRLLRNPEHLRAAQAVLLDLGTINSLSEARSKLRGVDWLLAAVAYRENPQRTFAENLIEEVILAPNLEQVSPGLTRRIAAGVKSELFVGLLKAFPARALHLEKAVRNPLIRRVLTETHARYAARHQDGLGKVM